MTKSTSGREQGYKIFGEIQDSTGERLLSLRDQLLEQFRRAFMHIAAAAVESADTEFEWMESVMSQIK